MLFTLIVIKILFTFICLDNDFNIRLNGPAAINAFGSWRGLAQFLRRCFVRHDVLIQITEDLLRSFI